MDVLKKELVKPINEINDYFSSIHKKVDVNMIFKDFNNMIANDKVMKNKIEQNEVLYKLAFNEIRAKV